MSRLWDRWLGALAMAGLLQLVAGVSQFTHLCQFCQIVAPRSEFTDGALQVCAVQGTGLFAVDDLPQLPAAQFAGVKTCRLQNILSHSRCYPG